MTNYEKKEEKAFEKIEKTLVHLDETLGKLEDTDSKVKHFVEQEKALHEIKSIIRHEKKIDKLQNEAVEDAAVEAGEWLDQQDALFTDIANEVTKLDKTLDKLDEDKDSKVKSYVEQEKALHEIKKIVKHAKKLGN